MERELCGDSHLAPSLVILSAATKFINMSLIKEQNVRTIFILLSSQTML